MSFSAGFVDYITLEASQTPRDGEVLVNRWWIVHPVCGLVLYRGTSPQCSRHREILETLLSMYPECEIKFLPIAYLGRTTQEKY